MVGKPTLGIIMGDPAGIGPEITLKALAEPEVRDLCQPVVIGDYHLIDLMRQSMGLELRLKAEPVERSDILVIDTERCEATNPVAMGSVSAAAGHVVLRGIRRAFDLARAGDLQAIVMAPITKESLAMTDMGYHSEFDVFAALTGVGDLRAAVKWEQILRMTVTGHIPFRDIAGALTTESIVTTGRQLAAVMSSLGHR